jgi:ABC-type transport system involved in cytochrome c biogenesis permease subunit
MEIEELTSGPAGAEKPELDRDQREINDVAGRIRLAHSLLDGSAFAFLPHPTGDGWVPVGYADQAYPGENGKAVAESWASLKSAFLAKDEAAFSASSEKFAAALAALRPESYPSAGLMKLETQYGQIHPFRWSWVLLALASIVLGVTSLAGRQAGYQIAWVLVIAGFVLQIGGFAARVIIGGRAPVTNMYESVLWVAFGTVLFAIIMEAIYRSRYMFLGATPVAVICLILADTQTSILDPSIEPLSAVLRNNFWLSTHVTSITLSYAAFALALGVGHIVLGKVLMGRPVSAALYNYLYRALQIGVLLLAIGTILGGVWANVSWGRFWDWDPKETWALIALLGYLALLHGRIAGWWKGFGLAVGSVLAFQSILMAWYGVNYILGAGLHSYGFGTGGFSGVLTYVILEIIFVALVVVRRRSGKVADPEPEEVEV